MRSVCGTTVDFTVGAFGNFGTIEEALASDSVMDGHTIVVLDGTYIITSPITVSKSVTICGASMDKTIFTTAGTMSDPDTLFSITVDNVSITGMTIRQKSISSSVSTALTVSGPASTQVSAFHMKSVSVELVAWGMEIRGSAWTVEESSFKYASTFDSYSQGPLYAVVMFGINGDCSFRNIVLTNGSRSAVREGMWLTTSSDPSSESNSGKLSVSGVSRKSTNVQMLRVFFRQDNFLGPPGSLDLNFFDNNVSGWEACVYLFAAISDWGDIFGAISLINNTAVKAGGKGLLGIEGGNGSINFRNSPLPVRAGYNSAIVLSGSFTDAVGSADGLVAYAVGDYQSAIEITLDTFTTTTTTTTTTSSSPSRTIDPTNTIALVKRVILSKPLSRFSNSFQVGAVDLFDQFGNQLTPDKFASAEFIPPPISSFFATYHPSTMVIDGDSTTFASGEPGLRRLVVELNEAQDISHFTFNVRQDFYGGLVATLCGPGNSFLGSVKLAVSDTAQDFSSDLFSTEGVDFCSDVTISTSTILPISSRRDLRGCGGAGGRSVFTVGENRFHIESPSKIFAVLGSCVAMGNTHSDCYYGYSANSESDCNKCSISFFTANIDAAACINKCSQPRGCRGCDSNLVANLLRICNIGEIQTTTTTTPEMDTTTSTEMNTTTNSEMGTTSHSEMDTTTVTMNNCRREIWKSSVFSVGEDSMYEVMSGSQIWPAIGECVAKGNSHSDCWNAFISTMYSISSDCGTCGSLFFTGNMGASACITKCSQSGGCRDCDGQLVAKPFQICSVIDGSSQRINSTTPPKHPPGLGKSRDPLIR